MTAPSTAPTSPPSATESSSQSSPVPSTEPSPPSATESSNQSAAVAAGVGTGVAVFLVLLIAVLLVVILVLSLLLWGRKKREKPAQVKATDNEDYKVEATIKEQENENETYDSVASGRVTTNLQQGEVAVASNQAYGVFET